MTSLPVENSIEILLVEDNPADARLTQEIIAKSQHPTHITVASNGEIALSMLKREDKYSDSPRPDLILLDLRLPGKDGPEVLAEINGDSSISNIPVMILTGTEAEQSLLQLHNIPPSRYCRKPINLQRFEAALNQLESFGKQPITMGGQRPSPQPQEQELVTSGGDRKWWWPFGRD